MVDDLVQKALARWPNVPAIAGWLKLSSQGNWMLTGPESNGLQISNERILNFISRNYEHDADGRFYFQNGPQKVFVQLECDPWVYRLLPLENGNLALVSHTGLVVIPQRIIVDREGRIHFVTPLGIGLLHTSDVARFSEGISDFEGQLVHQAIWEVPSKEGLANLPAHKIGLRLAEGVPSQVRDVTFALEQVKSDNLPELFRFVSDPKVEQ